MAFKKGQGGRRPGSRNRRTQEFLSILEENGFCPAQAMIDCYLEAKKVYENYGTIYDVISEAREAKGMAFPLEDNCHKYLKIAADIAKDLASYSFPKLKAIEHQKLSPLDGMTPHQKLEAMKQAVALLEANLKADGSSAV